jgi:hypothetical protein
MGGVLEPIPGGISVRVGSISENSLENLDFELLVLIGRTQLINPLHREILLY